MHTIFQSIAQRRIGKQISNDECRNKINWYELNRGMFAGIVVIVLTIMCLIMYFVLNDHPDYQLMAIQEVTYYEILLYTVCSFAVLAAFFKMRDLKFHRKTGANGNLIFPSIN